MYYLVKPPSYVKGEKLKWWYKCLSAIQNEGYRFVPHYWQNRPSVKVTPEQLSMFIDTLGRTR